MRTPEEIKKRMEELARQDGYIESIFNYCDRWCERCAFTSKCRNYAFSEGEAPPEGTELWEYLHNVFQATFLMLEEMIQERGIDPGTIPLTEDVSAPDSENHPLSVFVREAVFKIHDWLKLNDLSAMIADHTNLEIPLTEKLSLYKDSAEVIDWYNFFISAKITRAVSGLLKHDEFSDYDINGSAKVALVSIDRLIAAWAVVMEESPEFEDDILNFLIALAEIRKRTETLFPQARNFIRPGFDEFDGF